MQATRDSSLRRLRSFGERKKTCDRVIEKAEEVLRPFGSANRVGKHDARYLRALRQELRGSRILERRSEHRLRRIFFKSLQQLAEMRRRRRQSRLRLQIPELTHAGPRKQVVEVFVI